MGQLFVDYWRALLSLLFPTRRCIFCGQNSPLDFAGLCSRCRQSQESADKDYGICAVCPTFIPLKEKYCRNCWEGKVHSFDAALAVFPYQGALREVIREFKYQGAVKWARPLGALMKDAVQKDLRFRNIEMVVPVPLHKSRKLTRGYNQSELLAVEIGRGLRLPVLTNVLERVKDTPSQTGLNRKDRQQNLVKAFQVSLSTILTDKNILLVDDIYTTGATVETCARILKMDGAKNVFVITCAAGKLY